MIIFTFLINCNQEIEVEKNCKEIKGENCDELKNKGVDGSFSFFNDTSWLNYNSYEEKLMACQIPELILDEMCTYDLVRTCLVNYPFLLDLTVFNNIQYGFDKFKNAFNGIRELIIRCDGCIEIIDHYKNISQSIHPDSTFTFKASWGVYYTEIFLSQPVFLGSLSKKDRIDLFKLAIEIRARKLDDKRHGTASAGSTNWILSRIMIFENYIPFLNEIDKNQNLKSFVETMNPFEINDVGQVDSLIYFYAKDFIKLNKK